MTKPNIRWRWYGSRWSVDLFGLGGKGPMFGGDEATGPIKELTLYRIATGVIKPDHVTPFDFEHG